MGAKAVKAKKFTDEEIKKAIKEAPRYLSNAIKALLDDDDEGGIFYAHIIQQMCRRIDIKRIPTAAVSVTDKIHLYINPLFWMYVLKNDKQRAAVLKHEVLHLIFHHCYRIGDFANAALANVAADLVVNSQITPETFGDMMRQFIFPQNFGLPLDESLVWYYENYPIKEHPICEHAEQHDKEYNQSQGESDEGGDQGGSEASEGMHDHAVGPDGKCKVCGGVRPVDYHVIDDKEADKMSESMKRSLINDAINRAAEAARAAGKLPKAVEQAIELARKKPQIPWQHVLRVFASKLASGALSHTKKRISKRFGFRPGPRITPKLKVLVSLDVSGSISDREYEIFMNECLAILKSAGIEAVDVLEWDADVTSRDRRGQVGPYPLHKTNAFVRTGCGGTSPNPAIEWINEHKGQYDGVIWFTDGHFFGHLGTKLKIPSLWVITNDGSDNYIKQAGYRVIRLPSLESEAA